MPLVRVLEATHLGSFRVRVRFTDGSRRVIDLEPYLRGPIFEPIRADATLFAAVRVEDGALTWPNGADIDPDVLYHDLTPAWKEQPATDPARQGLAPG